MNNFTKYRSIDNFKNFIIRFKKNFAYKGQDENDEAIYDRNMLLPIVETTGTEKLHGCNASVVYNVKTGDIFNQSRNRILDVENDNHGFCQWADGKKDVFAEFFHFLLWHVKDFKNVESLAIFGEWVGGNIQGDNSAASKHDKIFVVFDVKVSYIGASDDKRHSPNYYLEESVLSNITSIGEGIYPISEHKKWHRELDINDPETFLEAVEAEVLELEENSVFGDEVLGISNNTGEGFVYRFMFNCEEHIFKIKGLKHGGKPKDKTKQNPLTDEAKSKILKMAEHVTPQWRLNQMYQEVFPNNEPSMQKTGDFIKAVIKDIIKEESLFVEEAGLTVKKIQGNVVGFVKKYLTNKIREKMSS